LIFFNYNFYALNLFCLVNHEQLERGGHDHVEELVVGVQPVHCGLDERVELALVEADICE
jgi:hypothetical protein